MTRFFRVVVCCMTPLLLPSAPLQSQSDAVTEYVNAQLSWRLVPGMVVPTTGRGVARMIPISRTSSVSRPIRCDSASGHARLVGLTSS
jgi:hypothetical protein